MKIVESFQVFVVKLINRLNFEVFWSEKDTPLLFNSNFRKTLDYAARQ